MPKRRRIDRNSRPALFDWTGPGEPRPVAVSSSGSARVLRMRRVLQPSGVTVRLVAVTAAVIVTLLVTTLVVQAALPVAAQLAVYAGLVLVLTAGLRRLLDTGEFPSD